MDTAAPGTRGALPLLCLAFVRVRSVFTKEAAFAGMDAADSAGRAAPDASSPVVAETGGGGEDDAAATKLQKAYRGYRTRRKLADSAVVAEELWRQALELAELNHSTVAFFDEPKPETVAARWNRVTRNASKVGQGLARDDKALKMAFENWIEAIDPRHRYGRSLRLYYDVWCQSQAGQPFFYWLDIGEGKDVDLPKCPRTLLRKQCVRYLSPQERENYEYVIKEGKIVHKLSGELLDTNQDEGAIWIFVMSTEKRLYAAKKEKGVFQHSSFLAGAAAKAAGKFDVEKGVIKCLWAYSGHYTPGMDDLHNFTKFLEDNGVDLKEVELHVYTFTPREDNHADPVPKETTQNLTAAINPPEEVVVPSNTTEGSEGECKSSQLGHSKLPLNWSTMAGPRIGCVKDYPVELRTQAMEMVDLAPSISTPSIST